MAISDVAPVLPTGRPLLLGRLRGRLDRDSLRTAIGYGLSAAGPIGVSGAHFVASLFFLRLLSAHEFGLFSFMMVAVGFGVSAAASLTVSSVTQMMVHGGDRTAVFKLNWLVCTGFGLLLMGVLAVSGATPGEAGLLGLYGMVFAWRWFARNMAYIDRRNGRAIASDLVYSLALTLSLGVLALLHDMSLVLASGAMLAAALLALLPFGVTYAQSQIAAIRSGRLRDYMPYFRDLSRWSLLGVALTEMTANAHAYLVTLMASPRAFALLALGMLLMRPAAMAQWSLPDMERPRMARAIAANDRTGLQRIIRHFTAGLFTAWAGTVVLVAGMLLFFPHLILKKGYDFQEVVVVTIISAVIMGLRIWRTPQAVLMQAAGEYKALSGIGMRSGLVSVVAVVALLLTVGPMWSLLGIMAGELVIMTRLAKIVREWESRNG